MSTEMDECQNCKKKDVPSAGEVFAPGWDLFGELLLCGKCLKEMYKFITVSYE